MVESWCGKIHFLAFWSQHNLENPFEYNLPEDSLIWIGNKKVHLQTKVASSMVDSNENAESSSSNARTSLWNLALENSTKTQNICLEDICQRPSYHV